MSKKYTALLLTAFFLTSWIDLNATEFTESIKNFFTNHTTTQRSFATIAVVTPEKNSPYNVTCDVKETTTKSLTTGKIKKIKQIVTIDPKTNTLPAPIKNTKITATLKSKSKKNEINMIEINDKKSKQSFIYTGKGGYEFNELFFKTATLGKKTPIKSLTIENITYSF